MNTAELSETIWSLTKPGESADVGDGIIITRGKYGGWNVDVNGEHVGGAIERSRVVDMVEKHRRIVSSAIHSGEDAWQIAVRRSSRQLYWWHKSVLIELHEQGGTATASAISAGLAAKGGGSGMNLYGEFRSAWSIVSDVADYLTALAATGVVNHADDGGWHLAYTESAR